MTGDADFLLRILRRLRNGRLLRFLRRVEQAELLIPIVQDVRPLLAAPSELGALKIQDDLTESLNLLILLPALFPERINGALQHSQLPLNCKKYLRLLHAAFTTLHAGFIRHEGGKILLVFFPFLGKHRFFSADGSGLSRNKRFCLANGQSLHEPAKFLQGKLLQIPFASRPLEPLLRQALVQQNVSRSVPIQRLDTICLPSTEQIQRRLIHFLAELGLPSVARPSICLRMSVYPQAM